MRTFGRKDSADERSTENASVNTKSEGRDQLRSSSPQSTRTHRGLTGDSKHVPSHISSDHLDAAHHLLEDENMANKEQRPVDVAFLCPDRVRRGEEGLAAQDDGFLGDVLKDGSLKTGQRTGSDLDLEEMTGSDSRKGLD